MHISRVTATMALAAGLLMAWFILHLLPAPAPGNPAPRLLSHSEALSRALPMCVALNGDPNARLSVNATASRIAWPDGSVVHTWIVYCHDQNRRYVAHLVLDAQAGYPLLASHEPSRPLWSRNKFLTSSEAVVVSRNWMTQLGLQDDGTVWRIAASPTRTLKGWHVEFRTADRKALVDIDGLSGDLIWLRNRTLRSHIPGRVSAATLPH